MAITALRISINKLSTVIEIVEDNWILYNIMMQHKHLLNDQVDLLIKQKISYIK
jgi:ParB family chromosome partitioning protein